MDLDYRRYGQQWDVCSYAERSQIFQRNVPTSAPDDYVLRDY